MPTTVEQRWNGYRIVNGADPKVEAEYNVYGTSNEFTAQADFEAALSGTIGGLVLHEASITERLSEEWWVGRATWARLAPNESGGSTYQFDTGGGTAHISQSIATLSATAAPGVPAAPDFEGAIGVTDQAVEGVDIVVPVFSFSETHYLDASVVSSAYIQTLFSLTGKVNSASFKGYSIGEVLFRGASGTLKDWTTWELTYNFSASPNASSFDVGPITGIPLKRGWDYLWVLHNEAEDATAGHLARRPIAAYVEQVYQMSDLTLLGI